MASNGSLETPPPECDKIGKYLRVLIVEDSEDDALLVIRELRRGGYEPQFERVETSFAVFSALRRRQWDLIISDYSMPSFNGVEALKLLKSSGQDIPLIIISGTIGDNLAGAMMKLGASDYMMKDNLERLLPSVERELHDAKVRRQRHEAEDARHESEARKAAIVDAAPDSIISIDHEGKIVEFNAQAERTFLYRRDAVIGQPMIDLIIPPKMRTAQYEALIRDLATGGGSVAGKRFALVAMRGDGSEFPVELRLTSISAKAQPIFTAYIRDLTEKKKQE